MKKNRIIYIIIWLFFAIVIGLSPIYMQKKIIKNKVKTIKNSNKDLYSSQAFNDFRDLIYPVGSIFMTTSEDYDTEAKIEDKFGGDWTKLEGRYLLGYSSSYTTDKASGSVDYTPAGSIGSTTLTADQSGLPAHIHYAYGNIYNIQYSGSGFGANTIKTGATGSSSSPSYYLRAGASNSFTTAATTAAASSNATAGHNHTWSGTKATITTLPPYYVVHVFKRVS